MTDKEKKTYVFLLSLRLAKMLKENDDETYKYKTVLSKHALNRELSNDDWKCYFCAGVKYPKSAINRVRIELNQVLLEMEKEHVL